MNKASYGPEEAIREVATSPSYIAFVRLLVDKGATGVSKEDVSIILSRGQWSSNHVDAMIVKINERLAPYGWTIKPSFRHKRHMPLHLALVRPKEGNNERQTSCSNRQSSTTSPTLDH